MGEENTVLVFLRLYPLAGYSEPQASISHVSPMWRPHITVHKTPHQHQDPHTINHQIRHGFSLLLCVGISYPLYLQYQSLLHSRVEILLYAKDQHKCCLPQGIFPDCSRLTSMSSNLCSWELTIAISL